MAPKEVTRSFLCSGCRSGDFDHADPVTWTGELGILNINVIKLKSGARKKFSEGAHDLLKILR